MGCVEESGFGIVVSLVWMVGDERRSGGAIRLEMGFVKDGGG